MKVNRDQVVAASLVGTVVVVLGYASGLGRVPTPVPTQQEARQAVAPEHPVTTTTPPVVHIGQPLPHNPPHVVVPVTHPEVTHPTPTHPEATHPTPTHPTPTTPPSTTPPPCDTDAIATLLKQVGALVGDLPVVSDLAHLTDLPDLTGALPLGGVLDGLPLGGLPLGGLPLGGVLTPPAPKVVTTTDNPQLNGLLGGCGLLVGPDDRVVGLVSHP